jgi:hypothetical protein
MVGHFRFVTSSKAGSHVTHARSDVEIANNSERLHEMYIYSGLQQTMDRLLTSICISSL